MTKPKGEPTYQTRSRDLELTAFRTLFHGVNVSAMVEFEVNGTRYVPVSLTSQNDKKVVVTLAPKV